MQQNFIIEEGRIKEAPSGTGTVRVFTAPTPEERAELLASCGIDEHTLNSMLDPEEVPRVEVEGNHAIIIWKQPDPATLRTSAAFDVSSVGMILQQTQLTIVAAHEWQDLKRKRTRLVQSIHDLLLRELLEIVRHYLDHLRAIKAVSREIQTKLNTSIGNEHLLRMFALGESLIYYVNAIEANGGTLTRLRAAAERIGLSADDTALLEDLIIENTQCGRQAAIYSQVLSGLMDARGNIVNNNMNILLKNLTVINVVFLPLGVLAGIGGMSEFSVMTSGVPRWLSYSLFTVALGIIGLITWRVLGRWIDRSMSKP